MEGRGRHGQLRRVHPVPEHGTVSDTAINEGHEIQIHEGENTTEPQKTGSVYNFKREERRSSNPIGEWNDYEIRAKGRAIQILLNGMVVNTYTGAAPRTKDVGYFGIQNHDANSQVHFRYVRIKPLEVVPPVSTATVDPATPASGFHTGPVKVTLVGLGCRLGRRRRPSTGSTAGRGPRTARR